MCEIATGGSKNKIFLLLLFLFSFAIRAVIFNCFLSKDNNYWNYDSTVYHNVAVQVSQGNGISNYPGDPSFHRVPGYSLFLGTCYKLFGENKELALWIQILFASFIPILVFILSLVLFPANILLAKISAILSSMHLGYVLFSGLFMTETFFVLFFLLFLIFFLSSFNLFFCKKINNSNLIKIFLAGIFLGISSLLRPVGHQFIFLAIILLLFSGFNVFQKIKTSIVLFSGWLLVVSSWLLRNYLLTGCLFFHTLPGIHFFKHMAARVYSDANCISYMSSLNRLTQKYDSLKNKQELNDIQSCNLLEKLSLQVCKEYPLLTVKYSLINMFKTCFALYSSELMFIDSGGKLPDYSGKRTIKDVLLRFLSPNVTNNFIKLLIYLEIILFLVLLVGFFSFIIQVFFSKDLFCLLCKILPIIGLFIFLSLGCGFARLRLPIEPFLITLSLKFYLEIFRREKRDS